MLNLDYWQVYLAAGISGLTGIVGTFFVKDYLGLSAAFLAALGFWAGIPWALKMPLGHLVDLFWRWKSALVFLGAGFITVSLLIVAGLLIRVVMRRSPVGVSLAWLSVISSAPFVGAAAYLLFGERRLGSPFARSGSAICGGIAHRASANALCSARSAQSP